MKIKKQIRSKWHGIKQRCARTTGAYAHVTLCKKWKVFANFYNWACNNGYEPGLWIDRKDNDYGYSPANCRWVTKAESAKNQRLTKHKLAQLDAARKPRKVVCVTTGEIFDSIADVTRSVIGRYSSGLNMALKRGRPYHKKEYRYL